MDTLPSQQAKTQNSWSERPPFPRPRQSQTTIDLYLNPTVKVKRGQNDIRTYFPPVTKTSATLNSARSKSNSPAKALVTPKPNHGNVGATRCQMPGQSPSLMSPADSMMSISEIHQSGKRAPGAFVRARNHQHVNSAVLPRFDPVFDSEEFPHSISPMAPRVTDIVHYSLVPKPLNIKMPPPAARTSWSRSQTTSSPSSVGDLDTASLDGERREAPSFKQTYLSVHSRQHRNGSPVSPLAALRDPGPKPLCERMDRPGTLRSHTGPKLSDPYSTDTDIYFLPKISPTSDSSADEREPLMRTSYPKRMDKASTSNISKAKKPDVDPGSLRSTKVDRRKEALKDRAVTVSPGRQTHYALTTETFC